MLFRRIAAILFIAATHIADSSSSALPQFNNFNPRGDAIPLNITCSFRHEDDQYVALLINQEYRMNDKRKIYGKHDHLMGNPNVTVLDASNKNNTLEIVPTTLLRIFVNLEEIRFENVGLKQLTPESFKYCKNIKSITFGRDAIKIASGVFRQCQQLERLEFNENDLSDIDTDAFLGLDHLKVLVLTNVNLNSVFVLLQLFKPLKRLEEIHITHNHMKLFPVAALESMALLKKINMSHNHIDILASSFVKDKHHLEVLDLSHNKITSIDRHILENWQNNAALDLTSNVCIDEHFESIGSEENPTIKVVAELEKCFNEAIPGTVQTPPKKDESGDDESGSEESEQTTAATTLGDNDMREILQKMIESEREASNAAETTVDEKNESMTGSPFDFMNDEENGTTVDTVVSGTPKESEEDESGSDEVEETTTTTTTTEAPETTAAEGKKKKKKKNKKKKKGVTEAPVEAIIEPQIVMTTETAESEPLKEQETYADVLKAAEDEQTAATDAPSEAIKVETVESVKENVTAAAESVPPPASDYLHDYEQASCRVYSNADSEYHCVIENATPELKRINVVHLPHHSNENVTGVFFRNSRFHHVPTILTETFPNLEHLSIEKTKINAMTYDFFAKCGGVKRIDMRSNNVRYVERDALKSCFSLEFIDLTDNPIETIEGGIFECNPKLTVVFGGMRISPAHTKIEEKAEDEVSAQTSEVEGNAGKKDVNAPQNALQVDEKAEKTKEEAAKVKFEKIEEKAKSDENEKLNETKLKSEVSTEEVKPEDDTKKPKTVLETIPEEKEDEAEQKIVMEGVVIEPQQAGDAVNVVEKTTVESSEEDEENAFDTPVSKTEEKAQEVAKVEDAKIEETPKGNEQAEVKKETGYSGSEEEEEEEEEESEEKKLADKEEEKPSKTKDNDGVFGKMKKFFTDN